MLSAVKYSRYGEPLILITARSNRPVALDYLFGVYPAQEYAFGNTRLSNHWQVNVRPHHINYEWDRVCLDAISEKVPRLRTFKIYEALAAIQQRRLSHLGHEENRALTEAEEDIQMVVAKHFGKPFRQP